MRGQGGCMAMEDACVLAEELRAAAIVDSALASYVSRRKTRVESVQHRSMAVAESLTIPSAVCNATLRQRGNEAMRVRFGPSCRPLSLVHDTAGGAEQRRPKLPVPKAENLVNLTVKPARQC
jgi:2-polyprenyl-6-methoxyphenol hydroxylase-like FAD-dependent oxidoreductase